MAHNRPILGYVFLPGLWPRLQALWGGGFRNLAFLIAQIYANAGILPATHAYLLPQNAGKFGIRHVMGEAANHLKLSRRNIDQIILYFSVLLGIVLLFVQFLILLLSVLVTPVLAQQSGPNETSSGLRDFFLTQNPASDIAFKLLDLTFGVPGFFKSEIQIPTAFHQGLHAMYEFYSLGLLAVGGLIILYFTMTVVAETAQSGTPFGKRFNHVWVPVRLVVFFALLIPFNSGLNGAQLLTLGAAKFGSGFATNGWTQINETINDTRAGTPDKMVGIPEAGPGINQLPSFMMLAKSCAWAEKRMNNIDVQAWLVKDPGEGGAIPFVSGISYEQALAFFDNRNIVIRFGEQDSSLYPRKKGAVFPRCGEITLQVNDLGEPGAALISAGYYDMVRCFWAGDEDSATCTDYGFDRFSRNYTYRFLPVDPKDSGAFIPGSAYRDLIGGSVENDANSLIEKGVTAQIESGKWGREERVTTMGWAGGGIWFNKIAQQNGALVTAAQNTPRPNLYPHVMEIVKRAHLKESRIVLQENQYSRKLAKDKFVDLPRIGDEDIADMLNEIHLFWLEERSEDTLTNNMLVDFINAVLGSRGLFDMCRNVDVNPMAQLAVIGKGLIESSIRNLGFSVVSGAAGGIFSKVSELGSASGKAAAGFFGTIAGVTLVIGFILFYVIPFMPFMYFFFAVGGWIKGIFEAMVAVPLWALGHLRIDGEGLPGQAGAGGYFLLLEIFIRPILIVFGLLSAFIIFTALVNVLNETYSLAVANLSGYSANTGQGCAGILRPEQELVTQENFRGPLDEFFYTVMYAVLVYMIGMSAFKLVDAIPNQILRWLNAGIASFNDQAGDPMEGLIEKVTIGGGAIGGQLSGALGSLGKTTGHIFDFATTKPFK